MSDRRAGTLWGADRYADHCRRLQTHGIDVAKAMEDGMLHVVTADDWYMKGGPFGATRMYDLVQGALAELQRKGRRARGAGVMDWALHGGTDTKEVMEYESRVNFLIETYDGTLLCVYDLNEVSGRMLMDSSRPIRTSSSAARFARIRTTCRRWIGCARCSSASRHRSPRRPTERITWRRIAARRPCDPAATRNTPSSTSGPDRCLRPRPRRPRASHARRRSLASSG